MSTKKINSKDLNAESYKKHVKRAFLPRLPFTTIFLPCISGFDFHNFLSHYVSVLLFPRMSSGSSIHGAGPTPPSSQGQLQDSDRQERNKSLSYFSSTASLSRCGPLQVENTYKMTIQCP